MPSILIAATLRSASFFLFIEKLHLCGIDTDNAHYYADTKDIPSVNMEEEGV